MPSHADLEKHTGSSHAETANGTHPDFSSHGGTRRNSSDGHLHAAIPNYYHRKIANPAPLGLFSFASTTLILSFYNLQARDITKPNAVVGMAVGVGGLAQLLAGMWEFVCGNTFGATAFTSYGGFWISYALIHIPGTGILAAYAGDAHEQLHNAIAIYLMAWFIFTFIMFIGALKSSVGLASLFFFLDVTFMLLMIGDFTEKLVIVKAGGGFGLLTAAIAYYVGAAGVWTPEASYVQLPVVPLS